MNRILVITVFLICFLQLQHRNALKAQDSHPTPDRTVDFKTQVMPLFSRHGCNAAECHGSATGRGDFKLSLFGGDPGRDYNAIVNELSGRRVNLLFPQKSLLITKPTEMLAHEGGEIFEADSEAAKRILQWIKSGAPFSSGVRVSGIRLSKDELLTSDFDRKFAIRVFAKTGNGETEVTADVSFSSSNPSALLVSETGKVQSLVPGKYFVIAKYLQYVSTVTVTHPFESESVLQKTKSSHPIDQQIGQSLKSLRLGFPGPASDSTFIRRIYLDLTGRLPSLEQTRSYLDSSDPDKKSKLIDQLLDSEDFHRYWTFWLRQVIQFRKPGNDGKAADSLNRWLRTNLEKDRPWSSLSKQLITATGNTDEIPAANFHRFFADARAEAETVANAFLGFRIGCANCHNHPLDQWTQEDYHGLAAVFATMKRGKSVVEFPAGNVIQPKTGRPAIAKIPGESELAKRSDLRRQFADWMVDSQKFKQSMANRVWKHLMGRGIVEPVDDFRMSNPPIDSKLLRLIADHFEQHEFRFKSLIRFIVGSEVYASSSIDSNSGPLPGSNFWAGYQSKPLSPEVYFNVSRQLIYGKELEDKNRQFLATNDLNLLEKDNSLRLLKGCDPRGNCIAETASEPQSGLRETLHLINGKFLNRWLADPDGKWFKRLAKTNDLLQIISEIYLHAFSRKMTSHETNFWIKQIAAARFSTKPQQEQQQKIEFLQDAIWSLINSQEFRTIQ